MLGARSEQVALPGAQLCPPRRRRTPDVIHHTSGIRARAFVEGLVEGAHCVHALENRRGEGRVCLDSAGRGGRGGCTLNKIRIKMLPYKNIPTEPIKTQLSCHHLLLMVFIQAVKGCNYV